MTAGPAPEKVFPAAPAPDTSGGGSTPGKGLASLKSVDKKWWLGGAAAITVLLAATVGRSEDAPEDEESDDGGGAYELDTSETDLYNDLQPELEQIADAIGDLSRPRPPRPRKPKPRDPKPNPSGPNNGHGNGNGQHDGPAGERSYLVKPGDTLAGIAKRLKVRGGAPRLYAVNRQVIIRAAVEHKHPSPKTTRKLYPGTRLVVPGRRGNTDTDGGTAVGQPLPGSWK